MDTFLKITPTLQRRPYLRSKIQAAPNRITTQGSSLTARPAPQANHSRIFIIAYVCLSIIQSIACYQHNRSLQIPLPCAHLSYCRSSLSTSPERSSTQADKKSNDAAHKATEWRHISLIARGVRIDPSVCVEQRTLLSDVNVPLSEDLDPPPPCRPNAQTAIEQSKPGKAVLQQSEPIEGVERSKNSSNSAHQTGDRICCRTHSKKSGIQDLPTDHREYRSSTRRHNKEYTHVQQGKISGHVTVSAAENKLHSHVTSPSPLNFLFC